MWRRWGGKDGDGRTFWEDWVETTCFLEMFLGGFERIFSDLSADMVGSEGIRIGCLDGFFGSG